ncbi:MAG: class I SAM-dependent methyltransferase [Phenylobacterium sp.]|uniref:class I SAM-dependent methyltransferase n=1 Tax=Phenylobacterium sp. TaxID=1871053 RepID=UPI00391D49AB
MSALMGSRPADYRAIQRHYEETLAMFGPNVHGVDWPNLEDLETRFRIMASGVPATDEPVRLLDVGCGVGLFLDYLLENVVPGTWTYTGLDISRAMVDNARGRHPHARFLCRDLIASPDLGEMFDFAILNGVFTVKRDLPQVEMEAFVKALLTAVWPHCRLGVAFNVMSVHLDYPRDDLFHWPMDEAVAFATRALSREVRVRADYGLYEYTTFVYREPNLA